MSDNLLRKSIRRVLGGSALALFTIGVFGGPYAFAGITATKHNLTATGTGENKFDATSTEELCVFCHTPHGADTAASAPLWNRKLTNSTYTTYNSLGTSSLDGAIAPVGSVSLACLSCHDGSQAMNTMINQPGSGGYNSAGAEYAGTWSGTRQSSGKLTGLANLGTDLRNDHPIGIQYGGGYGTGLVAWPTTPIADGGFRDADFYGVQYANLNGQPVWWVDTTGGTAGTRQKTDMMLYTRTGETAQGGGATLAGAQGYVECASCHDPHVSENPTFLRINNTGSAVCLACHIK